MTTTRSQRAIRTFAALGVAMSIVAIGCGDDDAEQAATTTDAAAESPYCDLARAWAVRELVPVDESDPAAFRPYWAEYVGFVEQARAISPEPVKAQWAIMATAVGTQATPLLEKYDFEIERLMTDGTEAEKALFEEPPADIRSAQDDVLLYESEVCAAGQPAAANVTFANETPGAFCEAIVTNNEMIGELFASGASPEDTRLLLTSPEWAAMIDQTRDSAPEAIKDDVAATDAWWRERQVPLWESYGYDLRKIMLEGEQADRAVIQSTDPAIREHYARSLAYEEQVCGQ